MAKIKLKKRSKGYWVCLDNAILGIVKRTTITRLWKAEGIYETIYRPTRAACVRDLVGGYIRKGWIKKG